jgi:hypothetical protein
MDTNTIRAIKEDFRSWSGGFPPDCDEQIFVYMEYAFGNVDTDPDEAREMLREWMCDNDDDISPFP